MEYKETSQKGENSVLDRIRKHSAFLKKEESLLYKDVKDVKRELGKTTGSNLEKTKIIKRKSGRPRTSEKLKAKDVRVTLKADLFEIVETRKQTAKSRSGALCDLLEKGLLYEDLRLLQAGKLKTYLKEFAEIFSALKIRRPSSLWRTSEIILEDNKITLSKLYKKSLQIQHYLSAAHINLENFSEVREFLTKKEIRYLEFSSIPERIASVVSTRDDKARGLNP